MRPFTGLIQPRVLVVILLGALASSPARALEDRDEQAKSLASYTMGVMYDLLGQSDEAIFEFKRSADYRDNYAVHLRLGASYARMGELEEAIDELNQVLAFDENNVQARYLLALIYSTQKRFDKAAAEYEAILPFVQAEARNTEIYGYLGLLYYSQKNYEKAIEQFETMLSLNAGNADIMFLLGALYLETGQRELAVDMFSRAIKVDPLHDTALNSLGYIYAEDNINLDEAQRLVERALEIDPDNGAYLDSLGWVFFKKGQYEEALKHLLKADRRLKDPVIYDHIGDVYYRLNEIDKAREYWSLSLEMLPDQADVRRKLDGLPTVQ